MPEEEILHDIEPSKRVAMAVEARNRVREAIKTGEKLRQTLGYDDKIIAGTLEFSEHEGLDIYQESDDPELPFSGGVVVDFNDVLLNTDRQRAQNWIREKLGTDPENAPISHHYLSPDEKTHIRRFALPLGTERWFLSQIQTDGEEPSYLLWLEEMYDMQFGESGYTPIGNSDESSPS